MALDIGFNQRPFQLAETRSWFDNESAARYVGAQIHLTIQFPEPDQAEKSADLVPRPVITSLLGQAK